MRRGEEIEETYCEHRIGEVRGIWHVVHAEVEVAVMKGHG